MKKKKNGGGMNGIGNRHGVKKKRLGGKVQHEGIDSKNLSI